MQIPTNKAFHADAAPRQWTLPARNTIAGRRHAVEANP
jgi:hypothetical protein